MESKRLDLLTTLSIKEQNDGNKANLLNNMLKL